jgi:hypothetical protein
MPRRPFFGHDKPNALSPLPVYVRWKALKGMQRSPLLCKRFPDLPASAFYQAKLCIYASLLS